MAYCRAELHRIHSHFVAEAIEKTLVIFHSDCRCKQMNCQRAASSVICGYDIMTGFWNMAQMPGRCWHFK